MIYVFKTSVNTKKQITKLKPHIDNMIPKAKWNFDLEDRDNILRIESNENIVLRITSLLESHDYNCEELE
jgi:hypothetical protein